MASAVPFDNAVPTVLAEPQPDGAVRCNVCAHRCLVRPGREGICHVRANRDGILENLAYGRLVAAALDPIEKKPLFHVEPGSRAWSIATPGCPFHCTFCQNWQIAQGPRLGTRLPSHVTPPAEVVEEALEADADAIAYTYVEPTVFLEYALDVGRLAREAGSGTCSSPTATRRPRRSASSRTSSTPRTSISRASTTGSTGGCAARGSSPSSTGSWRCGRPGSGWSSRRSSSPATTTTTPNLGPSPAGSWRTSGPRRPGTSAASTRRTSWRTCRSRRCLAPARGRDRSDEGLAHVYIGNAPELGRGHPLRRLRRRRHRAPRLQRANRLHPTGRVARAAGGLPASGSGAAHRRRCRTLAS